MLVKNHELLKKRCRYNEQKYHVKDGNYLLYRRIITCLNILPYLIVRGGGRGKSQFLTNFTTHSTFVGSAFVIVRVLTRKDFLFLRILTSFTSPLQLFDTPTIRYWRVTCFNHFALKREVK